VEIAAKHAKAVCERAWTGVEKRLLLDRIALHAADVAPRDVQRAAAVESNLADTKCAVGQRTCVSAGDAADAPVVERLDELARPNGRLEHVLQRHRNILPRVSAGRGRVRGWSSQVERVWQVERVANREQTRVNVASGCSSQRVMRTTSGKPVRPPRARCVSVETVEPRTSRLTCSHVIPRVVRRALSAA